MAVVVLFFVMLILFSQYMTLRGRVEEACRGRVAALDLAEWVPLCLDVLDRD